MRDSCWSGVCCGFNRSGSVSSSSDVKGGLEHDLSPTGRGASFSQAEVQALAEMRNELAMLQIHGTPQHLLLRCWIATKGNTADAIRRVCDILEWRARERVDQILGDAVSTTDELQFRTLLRYALPGVDRKARPLLIEAIGQWDMDLLDASVRQKRQQLIRAHVVVCELLLKQSFDALAAAPRRVATEYEMQWLMPSRWVVIFDMQGLSWRYLRYPAVLSCLKEINTLDERYYPDTIDQMFVVNAPSVFHLIWRIVSGFVHTDTCAKVHVLRKGEFEVLVEECGAEHLPAQLGGKRTLTSGPYMLPESSGVADTLPRPKGSSHRPMAGWFFVLLFVSVCVALLYEFVSSAATS